MEYDITDIDCVSSLGDRTKGNDQEEDRQADGETSTGKASSDRG